MLYGDMQIRSPWNRIPMGLRLQVQDYDVYDDDDDDENAENCLQ